MIKEFSFAFQNYSKNFKEILKQILIDEDKLSQLEYKDLLILIIENVINKDENIHNKLDIKYLTEINDGDYQGTLIYLIPRCCFQPEPFDYYWTHNYYGSCPGCDLLEEIKFATITRDNIQKYCEDLYKICNDLINNFAKLQACGI